MQRNWNLCGCHIALAFFQPVEAYQRKSCIAMGGNQLADLRVLLSNGVTVHSGDVVL